LEAPELIYSLLKATMAPFGPAASGSEQIDPVHEVVQEELLVVEEQDQQDQEQQVMELEDELAELMAAAGVSSGKRRKHFQCAEALLTALLRQTTLDEAAWAALVEKGFILQLPVKRKTSGSALADVMKTNFQVLQGQQDIQLKAPRLMFACEECISKISATGDEAAAEAACACASADLLSDVQLSIERMSARLTGNWDSDKLKLSDCDILVHFSFGMADLGEPVPCMAFSTISDNRLLQRMELRYDADEMALLVSAVLVRHCSCYC
jgi:hypothetical protein